MHLALHKIFVLLLLVFLLIPTYSFAQSASSPIAVTAHITGSDLSWGDLIDFDAEHNQYVLSQNADDEHVFGVAVENPPLVLVLPSGDIPVMRAGIVLVNVTSEGGPIRIGDSLISSSIAGKAMRAASSSAHIVGYAQEAFSGGASGKAVQTSAGKTVFAGTIAVLLAQNLGSGTGTGVGAGTTQPIDTTCVPSYKCLPFGLFARYALAALVAFGSVYLAFRSFMMDAVNGVISVGRNPRARGEIQGMVAFNAVLASALALAGLVAGIVILFIQI